MANETTKLTTRWAELSDSERTLVNSVVNAIASGRPSRGSERPSSVTIDRLRDVLTGYYPGAPQP